jgi:hypothetical protein
MRSFDEISRWLAVGCVVGVLLWQSIDLSMDASFLWSVMCFLPFAAAVFVTIFVLASDGWRYVERNWDLLVPLGLWAGALGIVDVLSAAGLATPLFTPRLGGFLQLPAMSVAWVIRLLLSTLFATWMTLLVVEAVIHDRIELRASLAQSKRRYLRVLLLLCMCWSLTALLFAVEIPAILAVGFAMAAALGRVGVAVVWMMVLGVLTYRYLLSLATAALLPVAVDSDQSFWPTLRHGIAVSWRNRGKWWKLLLVQYVLMGAWAVVQFQYAHTNGPSNSNTNLKLNFRYSTSWLGDYDYDSQWYTEAMRWLECEPRVLIASVWALLSALLSIVVKLAIVHRCKLDGLEEPSLKAPVAGPATRETQPWQQASEPTPSGTANE